MNEQTFWVTRGSGSEAILVSPVRPVWTGYRWYSTNCSDVWADHYAALGLPNEIAPGECWEVTWTEFRPAGQFDEPVMVPRARNVTDELKAVRS